jgi:hypothetical protein
MDLFAGRADRAELKRLLRGKPNFRVHTSKSQVAAALWDYGEDELAARAMGMTDAELASIENIFAWYEDPEYPLPMSGQRITHNHVSAIAAVNPLRGESAAARAHSAPPGAESPGDLRSRATRPEAPLATARTCRGARPGRYPTMPMRVHVTAAGPRQLTSAQ